MNDSETLSRLLRELIRVQSANVQINLVIADTLLRQSSNLQLDKELREKHHLRLIQARKLTDLVNKNLLLRTETGETPND